MESSGGVNKYLHKKFKKQTSIEEAPAPLIHVSVEERLSNPDSFRHSTNNSDVSALKSSITYPILGSRRSRAYSFVSLQEEPPGTTALVLRKVDSMSSEQSDEDISHNAMIRRSPKEQEYLSSSTLPENKISRLREDGGGKEESVTRVYDAHNAIASTTVNGGKYVCPFCSLACSKPSVLQKHIRAHTNERPYPCQSCNFSFKTRSNLYKHCRSRTHVNRVMGNKGSGAGSEGESTGTTPPPFPVERPSVIADAPSSIEEIPVKAKPYKPRFHTKSYYENENEENSLAISNEKNPEASSSMCYAFNKILDACEQRLQPIDERLFVHSHSSIDMSADSLKCNGDDQPLNLTSKNRKRCLSEVSSEPAKKSLIKELLLKNLSADTNLQCQHCKMIFRTFTELELHKMKMCKGRGEPRYSRSSSVNVASILTQNKNAFDNMPQNVSMYSLKSPGPFLGKTRLVESDKSKSFSCDDSFKGSIKDIGKESPYYQSNFDFSGDKLRKPSVKLFGGEVKVTQTTCLNDSEDVPTYPGERVEKSDFRIAPKVSENRVIRNTLQSGGIVLHALPDKQNSVIKKANRVENRSENGCNGEYSNIMDFSQNAAKLLAPNLKQLNLAIPVPLSSNSVYPPHAETSRVSLLAVSHKAAIKPNVISVGDTSDPLSLLVDGKVVRYVPGMPGPVIAETIKPKPVIQITPSGDDDEKAAHAGVKCELSGSPTSNSNVKVETLEPPPMTADPPRKFVRPNSLALKPSSVSLKHHHGLTPTLFNQILISPDTPRGDKKYNEQLMNGNYYSNLGLKSSTKPVYCTLNKTQPFYVPHFRKLSMYSEWRQQDNKGDKWYVLEYDSRQRSASYSVAGEYSADNIVQSRYKFISGDAINKEDMAVLGGCESHEDYTYVRGRGRGRYVCDQCGIRCKKPSMLRNHIRTHSNDRPYTCKQCKFSFKTKGNLTKHMKSKAHTKNNCANGKCKIGVSVCTPLSGTPSSDSDTDDDSGMDSSDEASTRNQEHEAAYGLLSLSQKLNSNAKELPIPSTLETVSRSFINAEQLVHVFKTNYVKNKILDQNISLSAIKLAGSVANVASKGNDTQNGHESRPLTYPYTTPITASEESPPSASNESVSSDQSTERNIINFNVIKRYNPGPKPALENSKPKESVNYQVLQKLSPVLERKTESHVYQSPPREKRRQIAYLSLPPPVRATGELHFNTSDNSEAMDLSFSQTVQEERVPYKNAQNHNGEKLPEQYLIQTGSAVQNGLLKIREFDNSAMETLADIATKQEKLEKNSVAKNVATEFLKLATKNENLKTEEKSFGVPAIAVTKSDLIVKPEENKNCMICNKTFNKPSQLRLHMNIHYLERPYRCDSCSVSFRTKGHLQKHERSAGHHNKLSSSPALSSQEPRPFKCIDCNIAFRIHGHLAKHLRSKMHIQKLECLSKVPFGLYAELERSNSLLTEINTADGDQCLDSLKALARRIFVNDPRKLIQLNDGKLIDYQSSETKAG